MKVLHLAKVGFVLMLGGCAINGLPSLDTRNINEAVIQNTEKIFIGIPSMFLDGSVARLNDEWIITAKHNRLILESKGRDVYYHPTCDVAVYRERGNNTVDLGKIYQGGEVLHVGYPLLMPMAANAGNYLMDVFDDGCKYSATDATMISGMSGGGTYNSNHELIGVNIGVGNIINDGVTTGVTTFISLYAVQDWLEETTGVVLP